MERIEPAKCEKCERYLSTKKVHKCPKKKKKDPDIQIVYKHILQSYIFQLMDSYKHQIEEINKLEKESEHENESNIESNILKYISLRYTALILANLLKGKYEYITDKYHDINGLNKNLEDHIKQLESELDDLVIKEEPLKSND